MASILETFAIIFESDADDVKKGASEAKKSTDTLNKSLKKTDLSTQKLAGSFSGMIKAATGALAAALSFSVIASGIRGAANYADQIGKLSDALDINVKDLDAWTVAVQKSGGTAQSFAASAKTLNSSLAEFAAKGASRASPFFESLGISMLDANGNARKLTDVLPDLAESFKGLSASEASGIGQKIGLDQGTIALLRKGKVSVDEIIKKQKELGGITKEDTEIAAKFNDSLVDLQTSFRGLFTSVGSSVLPALTSIVDRFTSIVSFIRKNNDFIKGALIGIGTAVAVFVVPPLVTAAISAWALIAPFAAVVAVGVAVIAVFALLFEDIMAFSKGQNSLLGDMIKRWPLVGDIVEGIAKSFKDFVALLGKLKEINSAVVDGMILAWKALINKIKETLDNIFIGIDKIKSAFNKIKNLFGGGEVDINQNIISSQNALKNAKANPIASSSISSITNASRALTRNTDVRTGDIIVNTQATDAVGISEAISLSLKDQLRSVNSEFTDGVAA